MSHPASERGRIAAFLLLLAAAPVGCAGIQRPGPGPTARGPMPLPASAPSREAGRPAAVVDVRGCDPAGKAVVVVERDASGRPSRWRYFARRGHHGSRALTCEAADRNGDGKVDARYFYGAGGRLVLEQRDMDFDGEAEFVADYSQFPTRAPRARAHDVN
jgi:hypothetical protein